MMMGVEVCQSVPVSSFVCCVSSVIVTVGIEEVGDSISDDWLGVEEASLVEGASSIWSSVLDEDGEGRVVSKWLCSLLVD